MTLPELIAALERAEGPSDELDEAIADCLRCRRWSFDDEGLRKVMHPVEPYTSSLDAALTLVPEGLRWRVSGVPSANKAFASCATGSIMDPATKEWDAMHATPALALCAAALKARA